jgi:hypothetical protein
LGDVKYKKCELCGNVDPKKMHEDRACKVCWGTLVEYENRCRSCRKAGPQQATKCEACGGVMIEIKTTWYKHKRWARKGG